MRYLKKFESFNESVYAAPKEAPAPDTKPSPGTKPGEKPSRRNRPSPIRRDRPAIDPQPKAEIEMVSSEDVIRKFAKLTNQNIT